MRKTDLGVVDTGTVVLALVGNAEGRVAERALEAGRAAAGEVVTRQRVHYVRAIRAVLAGLIKAGYLLEGLAELADVLVRAVALEGARVVHADSVVLAGPVRYTLVDVLLAPVVGHKA